jgi:hypothetical protein
MGNNQIGECCNNFPNCACYIQQAQRVESDYRRQRAEQKISAKRIEAAQNVRVGQIYRHYAKGAAYRVTGFRRGSTDCKHDGALWVEYEDATTGEPFITPLSRFTSKIETPRFSLTDPATAVLITLGGDTATVVTEV